MEPMAKMALRAARLAGEHIVRAFDRPDLIKVTEKGPRDYTTNVDTEAEYIIVNSLQTTYPDHKFVCEERGEFGANPDSEYQWFIDPINGTANFVNNLPHFCISIACMLNGKLEHAVIVDPLRQEEFVASRGKGCQRNGHRVRVRPIKGLDGAMVATAGKVDSENTAQQAAVYETMLEKGAVMREAGSAALDLAYIAAGRLDALWAKDLELWDYAAGALMVLEAGGLLGDFQGGANHLKSGNIIAAGPKLFKAVTPIVMKNLG